MPLPIDPTWRTDNLAHWDERVAIHLAAKSYDLAELRQGRGRLHPIEEAELGRADGLRLLHLQCHFGRDTLTLAQRGATVVGIDFSPKAIDVATGLAEELGLSQRASFVTCDLYEVPKALTSEPPFDRVFVTWGAINWLPDIQGWANVVAGCLKPGGALYLAENHPASQVLDDNARKAGTTMPGWFLPYFYDNAFVYDNDRDYANPNVRLKNTRGHEWMHSLGDIVTALVNAGLQLSWLHEHDSVPWAMFDCLNKGEDGMYRWPEEPWLPLAFSLWAEKPEASQP